MQIAIQATQTGDQNVGLRGPAPLDRQAIARWEGEGGATVDLRQLRTWGGVWKKSRLPRIQTIPVRGGKTQLGFAVQLTASITAPKRKLEAGQHGTTFQ